MQHSSRWSNTQNICNIKEILNMKRFSRQEIEKKVNDVLVDKLGIGYSDVKPDAQLEQDFGADSLDAVEIVMELEREFYITVTDDEAESMASWKVSDVYDLVERLL